MELLTESAAVCMVWRLASGLCAFVLTNRLAAREAAPRPWISFFFIRKTFPVKMWFASVCSRMCKAKPYINVFCLVGNWNKIWRSLRVNVLSKYPFCQNKPFRDTSWPTFTWCWFKPNLFCAHLWLEPITQSEVGPKTSLTMDKGVNGHELYLRIWNLDDRHEVYIRNWRNMFQLNYLDRENIFNTVQQGTLTHKHCGKSCKNGFDWSQLCSVSWPCFHWLHLFCQFFLRLSAARNGGKVKGKPFILKSVR